MFELYNWRFAIRGNLLCLDGSVKDHYKFKDYHRICTPVLEDIKQNENIFLAHLNNGDSCFARYDSHVGNYKDFEFFTNGCGFMSEKEKAVL